MINEPQGTQKTGGLFTGDSLQRLIFLVAIIGIGWAIFAHYHPTKPPPSQQEKQLTKGAIIDAFGEMAPEEQEPVLAAIEGIYRIRREEPEKADAIDQALALFQKGDPSRAEDILRTHLREKEQAGRGALREAAAAARNLAAIVYLHDTHKALETYRKAVDLDPEELDGWLQLGRVALRAGDSGQAWAAFQELDRRARGESHLHWQAIALSQLGDMDALNGNSAGALMRYRQAQSLFMQWATQDPSDPQRQRDLSVSFDRVGDMHKANGDGAQALTAYQEMLSIRKRLVMLEPKNTPWRQDLSVSHSKIGDIHLANGDGTQALAAYQEGLSIREKLVNLDPKNTEWQQDLWMSHNKVGDIHFANDSGAKALAAYQEGLRIARELVALDPKNTEWQRDLSVSHNKIGDIHLTNSSRAEALTAYQEGLSIREKLVNLDPKNTEWRRDLSVSHTKVGDVHLANSDGAEALAAYQEGLSIREELVSLDPANMEWQRDLSVSHNKIGDMHKANGSGAEALAAYQDGLRIARELVALDPQRVEWKTDLVVSYVKMAGMAADTVQQADWLRRALVVLEPLAREGRLSVEKSGWIDLIKTELAKREAG
uniref:Tetratricopeptide repeat-containing protein n=1 Tax=Candidatus Kentrum sp. MB TaxID=2138164 RepID=A0A450Y2Q3_9GAMM|nr:MAG: Tetratricopeptide repeat-containing protein [Candidatus Kentron sp. MB]VFK77499.1 MAG: Tetratricopeptide repeat-containing protein [Candidatus Kentron sp. MB]